MLACYNIKLFTKFVNIEIMSYLCAENKNIE